jgi:hypothetical protein
MNEREIGKLYQRGHLLTAHDPETGQVAITVYGSDRRECEALMDATRGDRDLDVMAQSFDWVPRPGTATAREGELAPGVLPSTPPR